MRKIEYSLDFYILYKDGEEWCPEAESNHRHGDFQSPALPTELSGQHVLFYRMIFLSQIFFTKKSCFGVVCLNIMLNMRVYFVFLTKRHFQAAGPFN